MTLAAWPIAKAPLMDTHKRTPKPGAELVTFGTETGPGKSRRRSTFRINPTSYTMAVSKAEAAAFEEWYYDTIAAGALPFTIPDRLTGDTVECRFDKESPFSLAESVSSDWRLTINIEISR